MRHKGDPLGSRVPPIPRRRTGLSIHSLDRQLQLTRVRVSRTQVADRNEAVGPLTAHVGTSPSIPGMVRHFPRHAYVGTYFVAADYMGMEPPRCLTAGEAPEKLRACCWRHQIECQNERWAHYVCYRASLCAPL